MSNETHVDGAKMTNDLWILDFMKRAAPQLRDLLPRDEGKLPVALAERLERLKQSESTPER